MLKEFTGDFLLTSIAENVGSNWSKNGNNVGPCVANNECITSATCCTELTNQIEEYNK